MTIFIGIIVNGRTIGEKKINPKNMVNTYFGSFGIVHTKFGVRLVVTTKDILVSQKGKEAKLFWSENTSVKGPKWVKLVHTYNSMQMINVDV